MTSNERRRIENDMTSRFNNYGQPNNHGEPNTDRVPVCDDKGARIFRFGVAAMLWLLAIAMGIKAISLWFGSI